MAERVYTKDKCPAYLRRGDITDADLQLVLEDLAEFSERLTKAKDMVARVKGKTLLQVDGFTKAKQACELLRRYVHNVEWATECASARKH